jgi:hypothetical protein
MTLKTGSIIVILLPNHSHSVLHMTEQSLSRQVLLAENLFLSDPDFTNVEQWCQRLFLICILYEHGWMQVVAYTL